jgi:ribonucleoside-diphosphate reductase alpha chain
MLTAYKYGWKTSYYQNTYDFKGDEEDHQPSGIDPIVARDDGEEVELELVTGGSRVGIDQDDDCEACKI